MYKKILKNIAMSVMADKLKKRNNMPVEAITEMPEQNVRIVDVFAFTQPNTFRGFKRYRLTTYKEPGVEEGIEYFRNDKTDIHFQIKQGTPIQLIIKEISGAFTDRDICQVLEVYAADRKIGVLYNTNPQFQDVFCMPFDAVCVRIEETVGKGPAFDGIDVYLFIHYIEA